MWVRCFRPGAQAVECLPTGETPALAMQSLGVEGFFALKLSRFSDYQLRWQEGQNLRCQADAYSFGPLLDEGELQAFAAGNHYRLWRLLGAHLQSVRGVQGSRFALWAPNAKRVSVVGDFNHWDGRVHPMRCRQGVWEIFLPQVGAGAHYQFEVLGADGTLRLKSDPLAFFSQHGPQHASLLTAASTHQWADGPWMQQRTQRAAETVPMSVYEVHLSSWRLASDAQRSLSYRELATALVGHVQSLGFSHVEFMAVAEHPFTGSWGYQVTGYYAPSSRLGSPDEFRQLVDAFHQAGIGVIVDWVPAHFPKDEHGLGRFDGSALYEHADPRQGEHPDWGTLIFNYGRNEVRNFLVANALYWLEEFHIDGLRVDAVASMLYRDYSRKPWAWVPNHLGGRENLEAIAFLRELNTQAYLRHPGCCIIAEESTAFDGVTREVHHGGLGFGLKWNMGWMHDTLRYLAEDPVHRKYHHQEATFSLLYAHDENFILPLSHDEVVHGKGSLLSKMPGDPWQQLANLRLLYAWMWSHPGSKLLFMGGELGQHREWSHERALDWELWQQPDHRGLGHLLSRLNAEYRSRPALHGWDRQSKGFRWLDAQDADHSIFAFSRCGPGSDELLVIINATPVPRPGYRVGVAAPGLYREVLNTDAANFGGTGGFGFAGGMAQDLPWQGQSWSLQVDLPPLAVVWLSREVGRA
jgi:1,4-alpha-glucan branching enzyme